MPNHRSGQRHSHTRNSSPSGGTDFNLPPLNEAEWAALNRKYEIVKDYLVAAGLTPAKIHAAIGNDHPDGERRSAASPYERERCRRIVQQRFARRTGDAFMLTIGNPRLRVPITDIDEIRPAPTLRLFSDGCRRLAELGCEPKGFAVFELHACIPIEGEPFWEPHFHGVIWGAPLEAIKAAFRVRVPDAIELRRRPVHVRAVVELERALGYILKFRPTVTRQYQTVEGKLRWADNRNPNRYSQPSLPPAIAMQPADLPLRAVHWLRATTDSAKRRRAPGLSSGLRGRERSGLTGSV